MEKEAILVSEYVKQLEIKAGYEQEQAREVAWKAWYKIPRGCDDWRSDDQMVECINHRMSARRAFDQRWAVGGGRWARFKKAPSNHYPRTSGHLDLHFLQ